MDIYEKEAWTVLRALDVVKIERSLSDAEQMLIHRIREDFPLIDQALFQDHIRKWLWSTEVERDSRVKAARKMLDNQETLYLKAGTKEFGERRDLVDALVHELDTIKNQVYNELAPKYLKDYPASEQGVTP